MRMVEECMRTSVSSWKGTKSGTFPLRSVCLLNHVRERIQHGHYSLSTEKTHLYWIRFFPFAARLGIVKCGKAGADGG